MEPWTFLQVIAKLFRIHQHLADPCLRDLTSSLLLFVKLHSLYLPQLFLRTTKDGFAGVLLNQLRQNGRQCDLHFGHAMLECCFVNGGSLAIKCIKAMLRLRMV